MQIYWHLALMASQIFFYLWQHYSKNITKLSRQWKKYKGRSLQCVMQHKYIGNYN